MPDFQAKRKSRAKRAAQFNTKYSAAVIYLAAFVSAKSAFFISNSFNYLHDYSSWQVSGGSDDYILSAAVHRKGFGLKLSARVSSLYI